MNNNYCSVLSNNNISICFHQIKMLISALVCQPLIRYQHHPLSATNHKILQIGAELTYSNKNQGGAYRKIIKDAITIKPPSILWLILRLGLKLIKKSVNILAKKFKGRR